MNAFFVILRIITALTSLCAFALLSFIVFMRDAASTAKQGAEAVRYTTQLFVSAFTEGTAPRAESWHIGPWQIMIGVLALAMLVSVFTPGTRWLLHTIAVLAVVVMIGYARMLFIGVSLEIICLPCLIVWFGYYALCLFWQSARPS